MLAISLKDIKIALHDMGEICRVASFVFLVPIAMVCYYNLSSGLTSTVSRSLIFLIPSFILYLLYRLFIHVKSEGTVRTKHAMITVSLAWFLIALVGSLPFLLSGTLGPLDSFFESMSGWTTTGLSMIEFPEKYPKDILFYRSLTQWVGGIGIIALFIVVFMKRKTAARDYYFSEVGKERIRPRIKSTILEMYKIYSVYTIACIVLLYLAGIPMFDSIAHSFTTLSTGGFSTHSESIKYFNNPIVEIILLVFMIIGATSFVVHFWIFNGKYNTLLKNIEFRYMVVLLILGVGVIFSVLFSQSPESLSSIIGKSVFQIASGVTTTGFSNTDIGEWPDLNLAVLMLLMYIGGQCGSTSGGIKLLRLVLILKIIVYNIKKLILPKSAIVKIRIGNKSIGDDEIVYIAGFSLAYIIISLAGAISIMFLGYSMVDSLFLSLSAIGTVGFVTITGQPWFGMPSVGKFIIIILMWIGRLEIFPVLTVFSSIFFGRRR